MLAKNASHLIGRPLVLVSASLQERLLLLSLRLLSLHRNAAARPSRLSPSRQPRVSPLQARSITDPARHPVDMTAPEETTVGRTQEASMHAFKLAQQIQDVLLLSTISTTVIATSRTR